MSKYEPLGQFLGNLQADHWRPTFHELERLLGFELPATARKRPAWWINDSAGENNPARAWTDSGWTVEKVDIAKGVVSFLKKGAQSNLPPPKPEPRPSAADGVADEIQARAKSALAKAGEGRDRAAELVRARPTAVIGVSAGIAFAAGVTIGLLLMTRPHSTRDRVEAVIDDHADDFFHMLKGKLSGLPSRREARAMAEEHADDLFHLLKAKIGKIAVPDVPVSKIQDRADDALSSLKDVLKNLHVPAGAADKARERAEDAISALRDGLKDLRAAASERFGR